MSETVIGLIILGVLIFIVDRICKGLDDEINRK
jgi:hypothetical protein